jgi:DNA end-binding protein Ku
VSKGKYVTLSDEELEAAEPEKSRTIEIEDFVELGEIDPILYNKTYFVFPDERSGGAKPFVLLRKALADSERVGIGRFVMRDHEYLVTLRPYGDVIALETMYFPDEVRDVKKVADAPKNVRVDQRELQMAQRLVDSLTTKWEPKKYRDTHRDRLLDVIKRKQKGEEIVVEERPQEEDAKVVDLMEVLRASIEGAGRGKGGRRAPGRATRKATKKTAKKAAKKRTAAKTAKKRKAS